MNWFNRDGIAVTHERDNFNGIHIGDLIKCKYVELEFVGMAIVEDGNLRIQNLSGPRSYLFNTCEVTEITEVTILQKNMFTRSSNEW